MPAELGSLEVTATLSGDSLPELELSLALAPVGTPGLFDDDVDDDVGEDDTPGDESPESLVLSLSLTDSPADFIDPEAGYQFLGPISFVTVSDANARDIIKGSTWYEENEHGQQFGWQETYGRMGGNSAATANSGEVPTRSLYGQSGPLSNTFGVPYGRTTFDAYAAVVPAAASATARKSLIKLVGSGIAENAGDSFGYPDTRSFVGVGPLTKYADRLVSLQLPRGHGWTRAKIVRTLLERIGVSPVLIAVGGSDRLFCEINVVQRNALATIREILFPELLEMYCDQNAVFRTRSLVPHGLPVSLTLTGRSIVRGSVNETATTQGPTRLKLRGMQQVLRDDDGLTTETLPPITIEAPYAPVTAWKQQSTFGVLSAAAIAQPPFAEVMVVSRIERSITRQGDTVLAERTRTYGWKNPLSWRYTLNTDGSHRAGAYAAGYLMEPSAVADDETHLYLWPQERFELLTDEVVSYVYDEDTGYQTSIVTTVDAWNLPRAAIKRRTSPADDWETEDFSAPSGSFARILANGEGVLYLGYPTLGFEYMTRYNSPTVGPGGTVGVGLEPPYSRATTTYNVTPEGFISAEIESSEEWTRLPGQLALYSGGEESSDLYETLQLTERRTTSYIAQREGNHFVVETITDATGQLIRRKTETADGHLPAAEKREDLILDPDLYPDGRPASRYEQLELVVQVNAPILETYREPQEDEIEVPYAESLERLQEVGWYYIRDGAKSQIDITALFVPWIRRGMRIVAYNRVLGYLFDGIVRRVRFPAGLKATTEITMDHFYL